MTIYVYKCVPCPRRVRTSRERRTPAEALAGAMEALMNDEAAQGWEYVRTDLTPMETRAGWLGGVQETHQGVLVFRRPAERATLRPSALRPDEGVAEIPRLGAARID